MEKGSTTRITYKTNAECWKLEREYKEKGFVETGDCYWTQVFEKGDETVVLIREE